MILRTVTGAVALLVTLGLHPSPPLAELYRISRRGAEDRDKLLAAGVPLVLEAATCLVAEGGRQTVDDLRADGREVALLDGDAGAWDYWIVTLRADSDLEVLRAAGTVIHTEEEWLLLRVPRGHTPERLLETSVFAAPLPHRPLALRQRTPLLEGPSGRRPAGPQNALPLVQRLVSTVRTADIDALWSHLSPPNGAPIPTRYTTPAGCGDDADYLQGMLQSWGVPSELQSYDPARAPNVVATLPGALTPFRIYIVIGHLDDRPETGYAPGADDNASGSVVVVESARTLRCSAFRSTVVFLTVTGEETGKEGSGAYADAAAARGDDIRAVLNMDMVGWEGNGQPLEEDLDLNYNDASQDLAQFYAQCSTDYSTGLPVNAFPCPHLTASDHAPFWEHGYRAVCCITDNEGYCGQTGGYPYYHKSSDTLANCGDRTFFYRVVRTTVAALAEMAGAFKVAFADDLVSCRGPARLVVGDRDLNTDPATVQTAQVEVWSSRELLPETITLTEESPDSMLFWGNAPFTLEAPVPGDGRVSVESGATLHARYVDALDCDGATGVPYEASALVQGVCGPSLEFDSVGPLFEVAGDGDTSLEPGEKWSVGVVLRNAGSAAATGSHAAITSPGASVCAEPVAFGTIAAGATSSATVPFVVSPGFAPCGGALTFDLSGKTCDELSPAGADEPGAFAFPVGHSTVLSPETLSVDSSNADAFVDQAAPSTAAGSGGTMEARDQWGRARRALVAFDVSAIPTGSTVLSATLRLYATAAPSASFGLEVRRFSEAWSEAVTWSTQPTAGGIEASTSGGTSAGWTSWDVTAAVAAWVSGSAPNRGFLVKATDETTAFARTYAFAAREAAVPANRPKLDVTYRPPPLWDCPYVGEAQCAPAAPGETAPGDTVETAQTWTGKATHRWPACARASGYKIHRGDAAGLPHLLDVQIDSCPRWSGPATSCVLDETPAPGAFYWYLVIGTNAAGDGHPGEATGGVRVVNSAPGTCP